MGLAFLLLMALTVAAAPARAQEFMATGTYTGDGTDNRAITGIGFTPDLVIIKTTDNGKAFIRTSDMPDGYSKKMAENKALEEDRILTMDADGFTIGTDNDVNKNGEAFHWVAMKETPGVMEVGQYTGNDQFDRVIWGFEFTPAAAMVMAADNENLVWRTQDMEFWEAYYLSAEPMANNTITYFDYDLMQIGNDSAVNSWGETYYYVVWNTVPGYIEQGNYHGNASDNRNISGLSMRPEYLIVRSDTNTEAVHRPAGLGGDNTLYFRGADAVDNRIQNLADGSFQVGTGVEVNGGSNFYYWLAFAGVESSTDLGLAMTVDDAAPTVGDLVTYTLTVTNNGPAETGGVGVGSLLPFGLTFASATPGQGSFDDGTGVWTVGTLANGDSAELALSATVDPDAHGRTLITAAGIIAADLSDPVTDNNAVNTSLTVTMADLWMTNLVSDSTPDEGETIIYTVVVANSGPDTATGVVVNDLLPTGITFGSAAPNQGSYDDGTGVWTVGELAPAGSATLGLVAVVDAGTGGQTITSTAAVTSSDQGDADTDNNTAMAAIIVTSADLAVDMTADLVAPAETDVVTFTITVGNLGPSDATGLAVADLLPAGLTYSSATVSQGTYDDGTGIWAIGDLPNTGIAQLDLRGTVDIGTGGSVLTNTAAISAVDQSDPVAANNSDAVAVSVAATDLRVTKTVNDASPNEGDTLTYTVTVFNDGPQDATGIEVTDLLPADLVFVSGTPTQGSYDSGTGLWNLGGLTDGDSAGLTITVDVAGGTAGSSITNSAAVTASDLPDPDSSNDIASVEIAVSGTDLELQIVVDEAAPNVGDSVVFTVTVTNAGPNNTTGVEITDLLPAGLTYAGATAIQGTYDNGTGVWDVGDVNDGAALNLLLTATVDAGTGGTTLTNSAAITASDLGDPDPADNSANVAITVTSADLVLTNVVDDMTPDEGQTIAYTITVTNAGPSPGTGLEMTAVLPSGVTFASATPSQGAYDAGSGLWTAGAVGVAGAANLVLNATIDAGTAGRLIVGTTSVTAIDQADPNTTNNSALASLVVRAADLQLSKIVDSAEAAEGQQVTFTITATNAGPNNAFGVEISDVLPAGLIFVTAAPSQGTYDDGTGLWDLGDLTDGAVATLAIAATVDIGQSGNTIVNTAAVTASDQGDPTADNDIASADVAVIAADLHVLVSATDTAPREGDTIDYVIAIANVGPSGATDIEVTDLLPDGVSYETAAATQGSYADATGVWAVGDLVDGSSAELALTVTIDAGTGGDTITNSVQITAAQQVDPDAGNNTDSIDITVIGLVPAAILRAWPLSGDPVVVVPGFRNLPVLGLGLTNSGSQADTLHSLTVTNLTVGADGALPADQDGEWGFMSVSFKSRGAAIGAQDIGIGSREFINGRATFTGLNCVLAPGDTMDVWIAGGASLMARDGANLTVGVAAASDLNTASNVVHSGGWPLVSGHRLDVDGFVAAQAPVQQVPADVLAVGSRRNLALVVDLPGNGYLDDMLYGLTIFNYGSAMPGSDIEIMEAWADDGDGVFDAAGDEALGEIVHSGELWHVTGLAVNIPAGGRRFFYTVDIAETAQPARDIRLGLPVGHGPAVEMVSGNDGPIDRALENTGALGISVTDRVILTADRIQPGVVHPDERDVMLLRLNLTNTYTVDHELQSLTVSNATLTESGAPQALLDAMYQSVTLRQDGNGNGELDDLVTDPALGTGAFSDGTVEFLGLDMNLVSGGSAQVFVTADLDPDQAADGDILSVEISDADDVWVPSASTVASWPLDSRSRWTVDGMVAAQIGLNDIQSVTLGPGDGPALALDLVVPPNGYRNDELLGLTVVNSETATATDADLERVQLWADGGNGAFDGGSGDDIDLGDMPFTNGGWSSLLIGRTVTQGGERLFVSVVVADPPVDEHIVQLSVPVDGIQMASGNSGPIAEPVTSSGSLVLSTSALFSTVAFQQPASSVGYAGQVVLTVRNTGSERITSVEPSLVTASGDAVLNLGIPTPVSLDLDVGGVADFTWTHTATAPGQIILTGNADGTGETTSLTHVSAPMPTPAHTVYTPVPRVDVYAIVNLPASVTRGVAGVVPLTLTLVNPGDENVAVARLDSLRLRLAETTSGPGIVPADLITRIEVSEGTNTYCEITDLPGAGDEVTLSFTPPVVVTGSEPVTLSLRIDLDLNTTVPSFLIAVDDASCFDAVDAVNAQSIPVGVGGGAYPIMTNRADLVSPAGSLTVAVETGDPHPGSPGQTDVLLTELTVSNTASDEFSSPIVINALAFSFAGDAGGKMAALDGCFSRLIVRSAYQQHFAELPVMADSLAVLTLTTPVLVPANAVMTLELLADLAPGCPLGTITPLLGQADDIDAEDANDGTAIPVSILTPPNGPVLEILGLVSHLQLTGTGELPPLLAQGSHDVTALDLHLTHPDPVGTASIVCDSLILQFTNAQRQPLNPAPFLDRIQIMAGDQPVGTVVDPSGTDGVIAIDLNDPGLAPQATLDLAVVLNLRSDCPTESFEITLPRHGLAARETVTGARVPMAAGLVIWPLSSRVSRVIIPAEELVVAGTSLMPAQLAPFAEPYPVQRLTLTNNATPEGGPVFIHNLTLGQGGLKAANPDLGVLVSAVRAVVDDVIQAEVTDIPEDAVSVLLTFADGLSVPPSGDIDIEIMVVIRNDAPVGQLMFGLAEQDVDARPPGGAVASIEVVAASGQSFPLLTEVGNVTAAGLETSFINYPNPFAAGREQTTFAYSLDRDGRVTLRLRTPHGELVAVLLDAEPRGAGLYQDDVWDGVNGRGVTVRNGVYVAEIVVDFDDGTRQRVLRKVAVIR